MSDKMLDRSRDVLYTLAPSTRERDSFVKHHESWLAGQFDEVEREAQASLEAARSARAKYEQLACDAESRRDTVETELKRLRVAIATWRRASFGGNDHEYQLAAEALAREVSNE